MFFLTAIKFDIDWYQQSVYIPRWFLQSSFHFGVWKVGSTRWWCSRCFPLLLRWYCLPRMQLWRLPNTQAMGPTAAAARGGTGIDVTQTRRSQAPEIPLRKEHTKVITAFLSKAPLSEILFITWKMLTILPTSKFISTFIWIPVFIIKIVKKKRFFLLFFLYLITIDSPARTSSTIPSSPSVSVFYEGKAWLS